MALQRVCRRSYRPSLGERGERKRVAVEGNRGRGQEREKERLTGKGESREWRELELENLNTQGQ